MMKGREKVNFIVVNRVCISNLCSDVFRIERDNNDIFLLFLQRNGRAPWSCCKNQKRSM